MIITKGTPQQELEQRKRLKKRNTKIIEQIKKGIKKEKIAVDFDLSLIMIYNIWRSYKKKKKK